MNINIVQQDLCMKRKYTVFQKEVVTYNLQSSGTA